MAFLIDQLNNSGLFAQSAYSAGIADTLKFCAYISADSGSYIRLGDWEGEGPQPGVTTKDDFGRTKISGPGFFQYNSAGNYSIASIAYGPNGSAGNIHQNNRMNMPLITDSVLDADKLTFWISTAGTTADDPPPQSINFYDISAIKNSSGKYAAATNYVQTNSAKINKTVETVQNNSATWNTVTDKLDTTAFSDISGTFLTAHQSLDDYATKNYVQTNSAEITAMIPTDYYPNTNPSGFITGVDLTPYQTTAGMTAYATTGDVSSTEWNSVYDTVEANSGSWTGTSFPASADEAVQYIQTNSGDLDDTLTSYQTYSGNVTGQYVPYNRTFLGMYNIPSGLYVSSNTTTASIGTTPMSFNIKDGFNNTYLNSQFLRVSSNVDNIDTLYINKGFVVVNHKNNTSAYAYFDNISSWNDATTTYQTNSGTYLTAHQDISANEWNETYETVQTNSASWAQGTTYTGDAQGALDEVYSNSSKWNNTYTTYKNNSASYLTDASQFYPMNSNPSGYLTEETDWTNTIKAASANAYNQATALIPPAFDPTYISGVVDNKLNTTAFSDVSGSFLTAHQSLEGYATTAWVDSQGFMTEIPASAEEILETVNTNSSVWNTVTGKEDTISYGYSAGAISSINGSALLGETIPYEVYGISAGDNVTIWEENNTLWISAAGGGEGGDVEVNDLVHSNSATWNSVTNKLDTTSFSDVSGSFLTAHQPISAEEWNETYETVQSNSASWGQGSTFTGVSTDLTLTGDGLNSPLGVAEIQTLSSNNTISITSANDVVTLGVNENWFNNVNTTVQTNSGTWEGYGSDISYLSATIGDVESLLAQL